MKTSKILWGLLVIGCGVLLLLAALGYGAEYDAVRIIGSVLLLGIAITSFVKFRFFFVVLPLAAIAYLWRVQLGFPELDIWMLLAASVVLSIGLSVLFHRKSHTTIKTLHKGDWNKTEEVLNENEQVTINSSFGEHTKYIHADNLRRVDISSDFSSVKVYFDQCQVNEAGLHIHVNGNFCGIVLSIPRSWQVENHISTFAASVNERERSTTEGGPKVVLGGSINFAEVKIIRV